MHLSKLKLLMRLITRGFEKNADQGSKSREIGVPICHVRAAILMGLAKKSARVASAESAIPNVESGSDGTEVDQPEV